MTDTKTIYIPTFENKTKNERESKEIVVDKKKRTITQNRRWTFTSDDMIPTSQLDLAKLALHHIAEDSIITNPKIHIAVRLLSDKLRGYRTQDMSKSLYSESEFIPMRTLLELMLRCGMICFYCKEPVKMIYEEVRDPKQWTLERIDNTRGHNSNNVEIACLTCNLRRRTMYHERYVLTKQMCQIQKLGDENEEPHKST